MGKDPHRTVYKRDGSLKSAPTTPLPSLEEGKEVVFIGAGNVATHLAPAMQSAGYRIRQVISRNSENARALAEKCHCSCTAVIPAEKTQAYIDGVLTDADIYIFAVKDDALEETVAAIPPNDGLWLHTAGSVPMDILKGYARHYGVVYPLQTLSKYRHLDFTRQTPLLIEGDDDESERRISEIAGAISKNVVPVSSEKRLYLHLAAVYACNFTNHLYALAAQTLAEQGLDWRILQPLIDETAHKLHELPPLLAQTGPALRNDRTVINKHLAMLHDKPMQELYRLLSDSIYNLANKNKSNTNDKL